MNREGSNSQTLVMSPRASDAKARRREEVDMAISAEGCCCEGRRVGRCFVQQPQGLLIYPLGLIRSILKVELDETECQVQGEYIPFSERHSLVAHAYQQHRTVGGCRSTCKDRIQY